MRGFLSELAKLADAAVVAGAFGACAWLVGGLTLAVVMGCAAFVALLPRRLPERGMQRSPTGLPLESQAPSRRLPNRRPPVLNARAAALSSMHGQNAIRVFQAQED